VPYQSVAAVVLEEWRAVERAMNDPALASEAREMLRAEAARLRDRYQELTDQARSHDRPQPPPFPGN
jgi:hypothetical protein